MKKLTCKLCGHAWYPRTPRRPKACPGCKRYDWDREPNRDGKNGGTEKCAK
jgi:hypothetical protein